MELTIEECNFFVNEKDWIFKLKNDYNTTFYILGQDFYKAHNLKHPLNKNHIDNWDKGTVIRAEVIDFDDRKVVVTIL